MQIDRELVLILSSILLPLGCFSPSPQNPGDDEGSSGTGSEQGSSGGETESTPADEGSSEDTAGQGTLGGETDDPTTSGADSGTESGSDSEEVDETPPTVLEVMPATGAVGVWSDATIVITFSEPMDRITTQAAWQSPNIVGVVMMWNEDDTELTVVPNAELPYATGASPGSLEAIEYMLTIDTIATDVAGNELEDPFVSSFFTWRLVVDQLDFVDAMTGMIGPTVNGVNPSNIYVGDTQFDAIQHGAMTFDLPVFPPGFETIHSAELYMDQMYMGGDPYGPPPSLGEIHLEDITYATEWDAEDAATDANLGIFSSDGSFETKSFDVTSAVSDDAQAGSGTTQFRLHFSVGTNFDEVLDRVTFEKDTLGLELGYLVE